jgi:hypothetical protein
MTPPPLPLDAWYAVTREVEDKRASQPPAIAKTPSMPGRMQDENTAAPADRRWHQLLFLPEEQTGTDQTACRYHGSDYGEFGQPVYIWSWRTRSPFAMPDPEASLEPHWWGLPRWASDRRMRAEETSAHGEAE